jgi:membrane-associated HD superfamily phosphohydrolase
MPAEGKQMVYLIVFSGMFVAPLCFVPLYYYFKIIKDIQMEQRSQRMLPLFITFTLYAATWYLFRKLPMPFINTFILGSSLLVLANLFLVIKWKISSHLIGIGGILALVFVLIFRLNANANLLIILVLLVSGFAASARLHLNAHNSPQVYGGFVLGFTVMAFLLFYF